MHCSSRSVASCARQRTAAEGASIDWRLGDLLAAPFPDACADLVTSTFGAFTVDDQLRCAAELVRMCRPGGTIALTAWHREGYFGQLVRVLRERHPDLVDPDAADVHAWADRDGLEAIFAGLGVTVTSDVAVLPMRFASLAHAMALFERVSGPVIAMRAAVEDRGGDWPATRAALTEAARGFTSPVADGVEIAASSTRALVRRDADGPAGTA